jgi:hypothetical protein
VDPKLNDNNEWINPFQFPIGMDLTDFMNVTNIETNTDSSTPIVAFLIGFIQHIRGEFRKQIDRKIVYSGHYTCTTKRALDNDFYFSDDMLPNQPKNVCPNASYDDKYPIVWLFYIVSGEEEGSDTQLVQECIKKVMKVAMQL